LNAANPGIHHDRGSVVYQSTIDAMRNAGGLGKGPFRPYPNATPAPPPPDQGGVSTEDRYTDAQIKDETWLNENAGYDKQENQIDIDWTGARATGLQRFGLNDQDPGALLADPFSRAHLLKQSLQTANKTSVNSYAAGGQLYSGALRRMVGADGSDYKQKGAWDLATQDHDVAGGSALLDGYNQRGFQQGWDGLVKDRDDFLAAGLKAVADAKAGVGQQRTESWRAALDRYLADRADPDTIQPATGKELAALYPDAGLPAEKPKGDKPKPEKKRGRMRFPKYKKSKGSSFENKGKR
jgi:hypothetical protein